VDTLEIWYFIAFFVVVICTLLVLAVSVFLSRDKRLALLRSVKGKWRIFFSG
jgi:hypothetical protein